MQMRNPCCIWQTQRGITGLETAIVLIAFVVVASVFAFAVLSSGLLGSEKSKETVLGALRETQSTLVLRGSVIGERHIVFDRILTINFQVNSPARSGESVDLSSEAVVITYIDKRQAVNLSGAWLVEWLGSGSGDLLDPGERVEFEINLASLAPDYLGPSTEFTIEVKTSAGAPLKINRTTPAELTRIVDLH